MVTDTENTTETSTETPAQEETDWKAEARKWEERAKQNRDENHALKQKLETLSDSRSELEKAVDRIAALEAANKQLELQNLTAEIANVKGVDQALLSGSTREELEAYADKLLAWRGETPTPAAAPLAGLQPSPPKTKNEEGAKLLQDLFNKE